MWNAFKFKNVLISQLDVKITREISEIKLFQKVNFVLFSLLGKKVITKLKIILEQDNM